MEESQPQDIEDLIQELETDNGAVESFPPQIDDLLRDLQADNTSTRLEAAHQLGELSVSSHRIVHTLITAWESDCNSTVRWYAADALRAPVHQQVLGQQPALLERAQALATEAAAAKRARQESEQRAEQRASQALIDSKARPSVSYTSFSETDDRALEWLTHSADWRRARVWWSALPQLVDPLVDAMLWIAAKIWRKTPPSQRLGVVFGGLGFLIGSYTAVVIWSSVLDATCFLMPAALAVALGPLVGLLSGWGIGTLVRRRRPDQAVLGRALGALLGAFVAGFVVWGVIASM